MVGHVSEDTSMDVPAYIMDRYRNITLSADIMHVNGVPFFVVISCHIKHIAIVPTKIKNQETMLTSIDKIKAGYELRGFKIKNTFMHIAFKCLREDVWGDGYNIELNCVAANGHEPHINVAVTSLNAADVHSQQSTSNGYLSALCLDLCAQWCVGSTLARGMMECILHCHHAQ